MSIRVFYNFTKPRAVLVFAKLTLYPTMTLRAAADFHNSEVIALMAGFSRAKLLNVVSRDTLSSLTTLKWIGALNGFSAAQLPALLCAR